MKRLHLHKLVLLLAGSLCTILLHAQRHRVDFTQDGDLPAKWLRSTDVGVPERVQVAVNEQIAFLYQQGYLEATIDSCQENGTGTTCHINVGRKYQWARLNGGNIATEIASAARFREKLYTGRPVQPRQVARLFEDLLVQSENSGYPFARVWLDSIRHEGEGLSANLNLERGSLVVLDSVIVRGTARTNMRYLHSYIGIRPGDTYNEALILRVERRIRELPFVTQRQRPYVQFSPETTKLYLFLDEKKASSINGILGLQPDAVTNKVTVTGDLDLRLRNALRRGEAIHLNWRKLQDQTQDLRLGFNLPFAFNTPFGTDLRLKLFKQDTTFIEVTSRGALEYLLAHGDKLSLFVNSKNSSRLGSNTMPMPGMADVKIISYGLGLDRDRFDYRFNPRSGHSLHVEGSAGRKRTTTAVFAQLEPVAEIKSIQYELNGEAVGHIPFGRRSTIRLAGQGGWMVNDDLYRNEIYRVGGLRTLRGVDEASIFASSYAIGTLEYRFLFEENSNFFVFVDQAWWEDRAREELLTDTPIGFGAGITFETKAGLFSMTYALGQEFNNPILLRTGKIHFGFISLF
jgi:outer membrane protein assembly factor BamA